MKVQSLTQLTASLLLVTLVLPHCQTFTILQPTTNHSAEVQQQFVAQNLYTPAEVQQAAEVALNSLPSSARLYLDGLLQNLHSRMLSVWGSSPLTERQVPNTDDQQTKQQSSNSDQITQEIMNKILGLIDKNDNITTWSVPGDDASSEQEGTGNSTESSAEQSEEKVNDIPNTTTLYQTSSISHDSEEVTATPRSILKENVTSYSDLKDDSAEEITVPSTNTTIPEENSQENKEEEIIESTTTTYPTSSTSQEDSNEEEEIVESTTATYPILSTLQDDSNEEEEIVESTTAAFPASSTSQDNSDEDEETLDSTTAAYPISSTSQDNSDEKEEFVESTTAAYPISSTSQDDSNEEEEIVESTTAAYPTSSTSQDDSNEEEEIVESTTAAFSASSTSQDNSDEEEEILDSTTASTSQDDSDEKEEFVESTTTAYPSSTASQDNSNEEEEIVESTTVASQDDSNEEDVTPTTPHPKLYEDNSEEEITTDAPKQTTSGEKDSSEEETVIEESAEETTASPGTSTQSQDSDSNEETTVVSITRTLFPEENSEEDDTTSTTKPTTTAKSTAETNLCDKCDFNHGAGLTPHPTDCTRFLQCQLAKNGKPELTSIKSCPHGLYWNQQKLSCDYKEKVQCQDDICKGPVKIKRSAASCRGYWDCTSGTASAKCCMKGFSYNTATQSCQDDPTCLDDCLAISPSNTAMECNGMRAVPGEPSIYEVQTGNTWTRMPCPPTLAFSTNPCGCTQRLGLVPHQPVCTPDVHLPFHLDHKDYSGRNVWVKNEGVLVQDGKAYFQDHSRLTINRYSGAWFGKTVYINIRFKSTGSSSSRQALISNGDCEVLPSLAICTGPKGVDFYAETENSVSPANFTVPHDQSQSDDGWQDVMYRLDDGSLHGYVDLNSDSKVVEGPLASRQRGIVIGSGGGCEDFTGIIDELTIYLCRPH